MKFQDEIERVQAVADKRIAETEGTDALEKLCYHQGVYDGLEYALGTMGYKREEMSDLVYDAELGEDTDEPKLGDYVETQVYGHRGRVTQVHHSCPQGAAWLMGQSDPRVREHKDGHWVSILVHDGGAVVLPSSLVDVVEPFEFRNDYASMYFRD